MWLLAAGRPDRDAHRLLGAQYVQYAEVLEHLGKTEQAAAMHERADPMRHDGPPGRPDDGAPRDGRPGGGGPHDGRPGRGPGFRPPPPRGERSFGPPPKDGQPPLPF